MLTCAHTRGDDEPRLYPELSILVQAHLVELEPDLAAADEYSRPDDVLVADDECSRPNVELLEATDKPVCTIPKS